MRNEAGNRIVDYATTHHLRIVMTFKKRIARRTTNIRGELHSLIHDILRREKMRMFKECTALPKEAVTKQHVNWWCVKWKFKPGGSIDSRE